MEKTNTIGNSSKPMKDHQEAFVNFYSNLFNDYENKLSEQLKLTIIMAFILIVENALLFLYFVIR